MRFVYADSFGGYDSNRHHESFRAPFLLKHMTSAVELLREREAELHANEVRKADEAAQMDQYRERRNGW
jgi:hypothetical protein